MYLARKRKNNQTAVDAATRPTYLGNTPVRRRIYGPTSRILRLLTSAATNDADDADEAICTLRPKASTIVHGGNAAGRLEQQIGSPCIT
jgi:hypothetical protein